MHFLQPPAPVILAVRRFVKGKKMDRLIVTIKNPDHPHYPKRGYIEVKNNKVISPSDLRGLKEFKKDYPEVTPLLLYRGKEKIKRDEIICLPVEEFLKNLVPKRPSLI